VAPFAAPSPIVWLAEPPRIIALRNHQGYAALVIFDPTTGQPAPVAPTVLGLGVALRCAATPGAVIVGAVGADGRREESLVDVRSGVITLAPPGEASPSAPGGGAPSPEGTLVASCRQDGLWVGTPQEPWARRLLPRGEAPGHQFLAASTPLWSPTGEYLAYLLKPLGRADQEIHIVTLGLEEILCRLGYEAGATPPALGATVWVCTALRLDALGVPYEPEWKTLKAQLQVTSSPATEGTALVVRARNVGLAGGVLKRLTGLAEPPPGAENSSSLKIKPAGGAQQTLVQSFDVPPRAGLLAWSKGASTGRVIGVTVTRRALLLIGAPAGP
jgi:hypothetical protein